MVSSISTTFRIFVMKRTIIATLSLVATSQLLLTKPAGAITFNFNWTSEAPGLSVVGGGPAHIAMGTVDINVLPGQDFTASDVSNIDITVGDKTNILVLSNI